MALKKWWLLVLCFVTLGQAGCSGERPETLGVVDGQLAPCPSSPNCVSTQATDETHGMETIAYAGDTAAAQETIRQILQRMERTQIVTDEPGYIHAEARSRIFRFVDDVEFYFDEEAGLIQFRSAARLGQSDMGVNRNRMEQVQQQFAERATTQ